MLQSHCLLNTSLPGLFVGPQCFLHTASDLPSFVSIFPSIPPAALQQIKSPWLFPTAEGHTDPAHFSDNWKKWNCLTWYLMGVPRPCDESSFLLHTGVLLALGLLPLLLHAVAQAAIWDTLLTNLCCEQSSNLLVPVTRLLTLLFFDR